MSPKYTKITVSGKLAVGTTTLAKNLQRILGWKYINAGAIQREYDRQHQIHENKQGAMARSDEHENKIDAMTIKMLEGDENLIYEAWLAGFMAHKMRNVFKVLLICSEDAIRIDRIVNRDSTTVEEAKQWMKQRESENIRKWKQLYGEHDFWDPKYYNLVIDTFSSGQLQTTGLVLDKIGYKGSLDHK